MRNSITSTAQMIEKMKSIADEKTQRFQAFMQDKWIDAMKAERELCAAAVWQGLFNLQLEMLKAAEAEEAAADRFPAYGGRDRDEMEAAAVKAEEPVIGSAVLDRSAPIVAGELWRYVGDGSYFFTISKTYLVMDFNQIGDVVLMDDHGSRHPWSKRAFLNDFVRVQLS